jgi:Mn2+/Fe2+ NRAMP family transporter
VSEGSSKIFNLTHFLKALGPGLIFAGTSIGVSHIVQSTRAGADYGFALVWVVVLANVFKFPFFEFAPRYVIATGEHLLLGYKRVGNWAFYLFFFLSLCTMFPIQSAVTLVTTGLFTNLLHWPFPPVYMSAIILLICCVILLLGRYPFLDKLMKIMIVILGVSTVLAFMAAMIKGSAAQAELSRPFVWDLTGVSFLLALMGWMPTTLEISVWHSFWTAERKKQTNHTPTMDHALYDFHLGYWGTMVMALFFLSLGALVMYGTGEAFSNSAVKFTGQVINLYTNALGPWSYWVIMICAATTMFSTTICCLDAFPRVIREASIIIYPPIKDQGDKIYLISIIFVSTVSVIIIGMFINSMKNLIDFATILAFLAAPIFAYINLRAVTQDHMPEGTRPSRPMLIFSWMGIVFLSGFGILFLVWRFFLS